MAANGWQYQKKVTVPNGSNATVVLPPSHPVLERLTIWASSGARTLTNMTFQPRVNGKSFGTSTNVTGAVAADVVVAMNGAARDNVLIPMAPPRDPATNNPVVDPFAFDVFISNAGGAPEDVTLLFAAVALDGG